MDDSLASVDENDDVSSGEEDTSGAATEESAEAAEGDSDEQLDDLAGGSSAV